MFLGREELWGVPTVRGKGRNTQTPNHPGRTRIPVLLPSGMKLEKVSVLWSHVSFSLKCSSTVNIVIWKYHQIYLTTLTTVPGPKSLTCVCGDGGFPRISRQRSGYQPGVSHFNSDTVYPEILSDFTGWGSNPINCLPTPLQAPVISLGCFLCFWPKDYKLKVPMTCPRLLKMPITSLRLFRVLLTNWLQIRGSHNPLLWFESLARAAQKTQETHSFTRWLLNYAVV